MADLLIGYAVGTAQIVFLEWFRERAAHRRGLRLYRSELQRLQAFDAKYRWSRTEAPSSDDIPKPPSLSSTFQALLASLDWRLTDEHANDESVLGAITIGDLCDTMQKYHALIDELMAKADSSEAVEARVPLSRAIEVADKYDLEVDQFQYVIDDALRDVERRLRKAGFLWQLWRLLVPLRRGTNPPPVSPSDGQAGARLVCSLIRRTTENRFPHFLHFVVVRRHGELLPKGTDRV